LSVVRAVDGVDLAVDRRRDGIGFVFQAFQKSGALAGLDG